jgi:hypothetical protein
MTENIYRHTACREEPVPENCIQCSRPIHADCMMSYIYANVDSLHLKCPCCHQENSQVYFITDIARQIYDDDFAAEHSPIRNARDMIIDAYTPRRIVSTLIHEGRNELSRRRVLVLQQIRTAANFLVSLPTTTIFGVEVPTTYLGLGITVFIILHPDRPAAAASSEEIQRHLRDVLRGGGKKSNLGIIEMKIKSNEDINELNDTLQKEKGILYCVIILDETKETKELMQEVKRNKDYELIEFNNKELQKRIQKSPFQRRSVRPSRRTRRTRTMARSRRTRRSRY